ncbi:MAG: hypothetical protein RI558_09435, partial [Psychroflexus sp.]|nr:hypothetical protein [Psychroflexus sp.]
NITIEDTLSSVEITLNNIDTGDQTIITDRFTVDVPSGTPQPVNDLIDDLEYWEDQFNLELIQFENLPANASFIIKVTLESGIELVKETNAVVFI